MLGSMFGLRKMSQTSYLHFSICIYLYIERETETETETETERDRERQRDRVSDWRFLILVSHSLK